MRLIRRMLPLRITLAAFMLLIPTAHGSFLSDASFTLTNKATSNCLFRKSSRCQDIRWTTGNRLFVTSTKKCLGAQGKSVGSEVNLYDCDDRSELQKWECRNNTLLALKGQQLYVEMQSDGSVGLSRTVGPNNHFTITGTASGACSRTFRELYSLGGNAFGKPCMFPFQYKDRWYGDCTTYDSSKKRQWCAVETKFDHELWGYCPTTSNEHWAKNIATGAYYQVNPESALTWSQAQVSCKQQGAALLSVNDPNEQAFVSVILGLGRSKVWIGLVLDPEHGWQWTNGKPFRYLRWTAGNPQPNPGHNCAVIDTSGQQTWESSTCGKSLGYICYKDGAPPPTVTIEQGFCASPWIPYSGHCFHLHREQKSWPDAQRECRKEGGDLVSIRHVEDQSFVISQLGYASTDELWIGLNDRRTEGLFDWSDQSTVSFSSWEYGEPTVGGDTEDCVLMRGENGNWADRACGEKHGFICMKPSASEATGDEVDLNIGCKTGWRRHGSYCYFVGTETKTFDEANEDCKRTSSYLADVSNGLDNAFLVSLVGMRPEKYFWIGLSNMKDIDEFVWTNNATVKYTHWNVGMPGHQKGCVAIGSGTIASLWDLLPCTNKEKYICKHLAEGVVATKAPTTMAPIKCPIGWDVKSRNYCFKTFTERDWLRTWFEARDFCRAIGGDLMSIHNKIQNYGLRAHLTRGPELWIGLSAPDSTSSYVWSDGSPVNFVNWRYGEPSGKTNMETCVEFSEKFDLFRWKNNHCQKKSGFACQIQKGITPKPPPHPVAPDFNVTAGGWIERNGNQYYFYNIPMANDDARRFCQKQHSDLVTIESEAESIFLWNKISQYRKAPHYIYINSYWLGINVDLDGTSEWMDGSPVTYLRWSKGQPAFNYFDEKCAAMSWQTGYWHSYNCGHSFGSICKRSSSPPVNATVAPTAPPKGGCKPNWKQFKSKCYNIIQDKKLRWDDARRQCLSLNAKLASIHSRHEDVFLLNQMSPNTNLWIGYYSLSVYGYLWTDGSAAKKYENLHRVFTYFFTTRTTNTCAVMNTNTNDTTRFGKWLPVSCNNTYGYICQQNTDPNLPEAPAAVPTDFTQILNDSIKIVMTNLNWDAAKSQCEGEDAQLVTLRNEWTQSYVELQAMNLQVPLWIGLNTNVTGGYFHFIDGWHLSFTKWGSWEPRPNRPCVFVDIDGSWKTTFCNRTMASACMRSTDVPLTESTVFPGVCPNDIHSALRKNLWFPFKGHCYKIFTEEILWRLASVSCVENGATLVSIEDPSEQEFIYSKVKELKDHYPGFWIGLFTNHKGQWKWLNNTLMDYINWDKDEPRYYSSTILKTSDGTWTTTFSYLVHPYICKTPKVMPQNKPTPSTEPVHLSPRSHSRVIIIVVIFLITLALGIAIFVFKKCGNRLPILIPAKLSNTFDNPLFVSSERSQPEVCETNGLPKNKEENIEPLSTTQLSSSSL